MRWLNSSRTRWLLVGTAAIIAVGSGRVKADFAFGTPTNLGPVVNSPYHDQLTSISGDGLSLYFNSDRPGGFGSWDIWVARRNSISEPWQEPVNLGPAVNSSDQEWSPRVSFDGRQLYFRSTGLSPGDSGDIWVTTRASTNDEWGEPVNVGPPVSTSAFDTDPGGLSADGLEFYFDSKRAGSLGDVDIYVTTREAIDAPWGEPVNLGPILNTPGIDTYANISADGRVLFVSRTIGYGLYDLWMTTRQSSNTPWSEPINLGPKVNTANSECGASISADGRTLYFSDYYYAGIRPNGHGGSDLYQVRLIPIVDFSGDGKVDGREILALADRWGTGDSLCDIGPMPWGDSVVDLEDLRVLAEYMGQEVVDPTLTAHWALDEAEGDIAHDSAGDKDGVVMGTCAWQPAGGQVNGALEFDGATYIAAGHVLSPLDGPFSVLAWVKGGTAGQVIVSQTGGNNWLMADALEGTLATGLAPSARNPLPPLVSEAIITDGDWHHVAFTCDGSHRRLYVDDVLVVEDTEASLAECYGGLNIGCGKDMAPEIFFTGLIDDVRIYNRAVKPQNITPTL